MSEQTCWYCGKDNNTPGFYVGASLGPDWTMWEGTGKMTCPAKKCYEAGKEESRALIDNMAQNP